MDSAELLAHVSRFGLAFLFAAAATAKIANLGHFRDAVANYRVLPGPLVRPVAATLPFAEALAAALLLVGVAVQAVAVATMALLLAFTAAVAVNLARGRDLDCGCFGAGAPRRLTWWTAARNLVLVGMATTVALGRPDGLALWAWGPSDSRPSFQDVVAAAALAFVAVTATFVCAEAMDVRRRLRSLRAVKALDGGTS